jgi:hypothetical protein
VETLRVSRRGYLSAAPAETGGLHVIPLRSMPLAAPVSPARYSGETTSRRSHLRPFVRTMA